MKLHPNFKSGKWEIPPFRLFPLDGSFKAQLPPPEVTH